jgi:hypothetical protein
MDPRHVAELPNDVPNEAVVKARRRRASVGPHLHDEQVTDSLDKAATLLDAPAVAEKTRKRRENEKLQKGAARAANGRWTRIANHQIEVFIHTAKDNRMAGDENGAKIHKSVPDGGRIRKGIDPGNRRTALALVDPGVEEVLRRLKVFQPGIPAVEQRESSKTRDDALGHVARRVPVAPDLAVEKRNEPGGLDHLVMNRPDGRGCHAADRILDQIIIVEPLRIALIGLGTISYASRSRASPTQERTAQSSPDKCVLVS